MKLSNHHIEVIENFDRLPDNASVRAAVVGALLGISKPTLWRWNAAGKLGEPIRPSRGVTAWRVGAIRKLLQNGGARA